MLKIVKRLIEKRKHAKRAKIERAVLLDREGTKRWYDVEDDLPPFDEWLLGYSEVFGSYYICKYRPSRGWVGLNNDSLANISQWCDEPLFMPFELRNEVSVFYAEKHGFKVQ